MKSKPITRWEQNITDSHKEKEATAKKKTEPENEILFWCSYCGQKYRLARNQSGNAGSCDRCQNDFIIPYVSQTKPKLIKTISFSCKHCGKKMLKAQELVGVQITCCDCAEKIIVPEKSSKSTSPEEIVVETTRTNLQAPKINTLPEEKILFWCKCCGQKYRLPQQMAGKAGSCDICQNDFIIPKLSQTKPELKKTIAFPCEHCGKKLLKPQDFAGTEISCHECGENNIVPEKSKKTLLQKISHAPFISVETTRTNIPAAVPAAKTKTTAKDKILFWCGQCGLKYRLPRDLVGKTGICARCQNYLFIPKVSQTKPELDNSLIFPCKYCGTKMRKARKLAGTEAKCSKCGKNNIIPEKSKISALAKTGAAPEERILFWCDTCGQKYRLPQHLAGKPGTCDKCKSDFVIPQQSQTKPKLKRTILFWCSCCGQKYRLPQQLAGKTATCDRCYNDLLVPTVSQTQPMPEESIAFPCEHCKAKLRKAKKFAGQEVICHKCGEKVIIPKKSKRSLVQKISPVKLLETFIVTEQTRTDLVVVGRKPTQDLTELNVSDEAKMAAAKAAKSAKASEKAALQKSSDSSLAVEKTQKSINTYPRKKSFYKALPSPKPLIIITEDPPTLHKIKNYFHKKAEKYFIFATLVIFTDYLIDRYSDRRHSSKIFVIFSSISIALMIMFATWSYVTRKPPNKTSKCRYNIACIKCKKSEIRRFKNISKQTCSSSKCSQPVGLVYRCKKCKKYFVYNELKSKRELKGKNLRDAKRKAKKNKSEVKVEDSIYSNSITIKCPFCRSENVHYVTVKEAESLKKKYSKK